MYSYDTHWQLRLETSAERPVFVIRVTPESAAPYYLSSTEMSVRRQHQKTVFTHAQSPLRVTTQLRPIASEVEQISLQLTNTGTACLALQLFTPLLTDLATRGVVGYVSHEQGDVLPVQESDYQVYASNPQAPMFMLLHAGENGIGLGRMANTTADSRTGVLIHGAGIPLGLFAVPPADSLGAERPERMLANLGGVASFLEDLRLPGNATTHLGPYLLIRYEGDWTEGAARLKALRASRAEFRQWA